MKKKIYKVIITSIFIAFLLLLGLNNNSYAVLQANGATPATQTLQNWLYNVRAMEASGQALGLTESINGDTLMPSSSNGLDSHMEKNTEYGAMAILSASSYGNPSKIENGGTTTGNKSGIVININNEMVAAGDSLINDNNNVPRFKTSNEKYKNVYAMDGYVKKVGDAIDIGAWHGASGNMWLTYRNARGDYVIGGYTSILLRSHSGSLFSFFGLSRYTSSTSDREHYAAYYTNSWATRGVVVVGDGV